VQTGQPAVGAFSHAAELEPTGGGPSWRVCGSRV